MFTFHFPLAPFSLVFLLCQLYHFSFLYLDMHRMNMRIPCHVTPSIYFHVLKQHLYYNPAKFCLILVRGKFSAAKQIIKKSHLLEHELTLQVMAFTMHTTASRFTGHHVLCMSTSSTVSMGERVARQHNPTTNLHLLTLCK